MRRSILKYSKTCILILFLPIRVVYFLCLKPIFKFLAQDQINYEKAKYDNLLKEYREKNKAYKDGVKKLEKINNKLVRLEKIFERYKGWQFEIASTNKEELVFIFSNNQKDLYSFNLCGMDGSHYRNDCHICLEKHFENLKIVDIISNTTNRGYARVLLEFTIKRAKELGIKKIYGDLSPADSKRFDWLIPFYESLNFQCTLFNDVDRKMDGKILMSLV